MYGLPLCAPHHLDDELFARLHILHGLPVLAAHTQTNTMGGPEFRHLGLRVVGYTILWSGRPRGGSHGQTSRGRHGSDHAHHVGHAQASMARVATAGTPARYNSHLAKWPHSLEVAPCHVVFAQGNDLGAGLPRNDRALRRPAQSHAQTCAERLQAT
jgi:hypothetical protein